MITHRRAALHCAALRIAFRSIFSTHAQGGDACIIIESNQAFHLLPICKLQQRSYEYIWICMKVNVRDDGEWLTCQLAQRSAAGEYTHSAAPRSARVGMQLYTAMLHLFISIILKQFAATQAKLNIKCSVCVSHISNTVCIIKTQHKSFIDKSSLSN